MSHTKYLLGQNLDVTAAMRVTRQAQLSGKSEFRRLRFRSWLDLTFSNNNKKKLAKPLVIHHFTLIGRGRRELSNENGTE